MTNKVISDGSTASYYELPKDASVLTDCIGYKNMGYHIGCIFTTCFIYGEAVNVTNELKLKPSFRELQDLISVKDMNGQIAEIFRSSYRYGQVSHSETLRDAKKMKFYAQREIERLAEYGAGDLRKSVHAQLILKHAKLEIRRIMKYTEKRPSGLILAKMETSYGAEPDPETIFPAANLSIEPVTVSVQKHEGTPSDENSYGPPSNENSSGSWADASPCSDPRRFRNGTLVTTTVKSPGGHYVEGQHAIVREVFYHNHVVQSADLTFKPFTSKEMVMNVPAANFRATMYVDLE